MQLAHHDIINRVQYFLSILSAKKGDVSKRGAYQVCVTAWSCVLPDSGRPTGISEEYLQRDYGQTQCRRWQERASGGFFWNYGSHAGREWDYNEMVEEGAIRPPAESLLTRIEVLARLQTAENNMKSLREAKQREVSNISRLLSVFSMAV